MSANFDLLKAEIVRPDKSKHLAPLMRFRGGLTMAQTHARWNFLNAMFLAECKSLADGVKMFKSGEVAHICGFHTKGIESRALDAFCNRVRLSPKVAAMVPGLHDYASSLVRWAFDIQITGQCVSRKTKNHRVLNELKGKNSDPSTMLYPFVSKSAKNDCEILQLVHAAVPASVSDKIRGDLCQDLVVAILAGDLKAENLPDAVPAYLRNAKHFFPRQADDLILKGARPWGQSENRADHRMAWQELWQETNFVDERSWEEKIGGLADKWGCSHS